jgi:hypothetical protein
MPASDRRRPSTFEPYTFAVPNLPKPIYEMVAPLKADLGDVTARTVVALGIVALRRLLDKSPDNRAPLEELMRIHGLT